MDYRAHLFASIGNNKIHPSRTQCGRHLFRNSRGTHVVKLKQFIELAKEDEKNVCSKCLTWAKENNKINEKEKETKMKKQNNEVKRMQQLAGILKENVTQLSTDGIFDNPDASHVISNEENKVLFRYFQEEQDEEIPNVAGKSTAVAAKIIGPKGYEEETLQHILVTLFPNKYEGIY